MIKDLLGGGLGAELKIAPFWGVFCVNLSCVTRVPHHRAHTPPSPRRQDDASMTKTQAPGGWALPEQITGCRGRSPLRARGT